MPTTDVFDPAPDVRYNPHVTGYDHPTRGRVRQAQEQVALLVTKSIRDTATAAHMLEPETLTLAFKRTRLVEQLYGLGLAGVGDIRAEYAALAAQAIVLAEEADRPHEMRGVRAPRRLVAPRDAPLRLAPLIED